MKEELAKLKAELKDIKSITPNDNLRYLQSQIRLGNIEIEEKDRVLTILGRVELGMQAQLDTISELRKNMKELRKELNNNKK